MIKLDGQSYRRLLASIASVFASVFLISTCDAQVGTVQQGVTSYTKIRPESIKPLPREVFKSADLSGYVPTNQWWSSLLWQRYSSNMFPHPLGIVACEQGLSISYPGSAIVANKDAIMGGGVSEKGDIVIGLNAAEAFEDARLKGYSSWFVSTDFSAGTSKLVTRFGLGSPFVFGQFENGKPKLTFFESPRLWAGEAKTAAVGITVRGNHYGLFGPTGSRWQIVGEKAVTLETDKDYFSIALLPDDRMETFQRFKAVAHNHVVDTDFDFEIAAGKLQTKWMLKTESKEPSKEAGTVVALYPHQWKYADGVEFLDGAYRSVRGQMKLIRGDGFRTSIPMQGILPILPAAGVLDRQALESFLDVEIAKKAPSIRDTYWDGKYLGKLATLAGVAEALGDLQRQRIFIDRIKARLENWFVADAGESSPLFYYDDRWGTLIGSEPSYGSDRELNDHHFHYGYFIRAAAEVARHDQAWAKKWRPMVELLISDIANVDDSENRFPHLRCFDPYAGHSWASGHARFGDGNNLESSSEAMNAWYGISLWGAATDNKKLRDLGLFLFNTDRTAIEEYWFDVSDTNFPKDFPNEALGIVWGGKGDFGTWFSADPDCIHGINWLPFTPASIYLGRDQNYVARAYRSVLKKRKQGPDLGQGWGDLVIMFGALADSRSAVKLLEKFPEGSIEKGNCRAFMYQWIHMLDQIGGTDTETTADYPFANVFTRNGVKTYVIYNFESGPLTVTFSDGKRIEASGAGLHVKR